MTIWEFGNRIAKKTYVSDLQDIDCSKTVCCKVGAHIRSWVGHDSHSVLYLILKKSYRDRDFAPPRLSPTKM